MAAVTTADGQTVYLPDDMAAPSGPADIAPPPLPTNPVGQIDPSLIANIGATSTQDNATSGGTPVISQLPTLGPGGIPNVDPISLPPPVAPGPKPMQPDGIPESHNGQDFVAGIVDANGKITAPPPVVPPKDAAAPPGVPASPTAGTGTQLEQKATNEELQAIQDKQKAQAAEAENQKAIADAQYVIGQQRMIDVDKANAEIQQKHEEYQARIDKSRDDYTKAVQVASQTKIDPQRLYADQSTGQKILGWISVLASGVGAALQGPGAQNLALAEMHKAIDRDVDAQKANLENQWKGVNAKKANVDDLVKQQEEAFKWGEQKKAELLQRSADMMDLTAKKYAGTTIGNNLAMGAAANRAEAAKVIGNLATFTVGREDKAIEQKQKQQEIGIAAGHLAETIRHNKFEEDLAQQQKDMEAAKAAAAKNGVLDPTQTGRAIMVPNGTNPDGSIHYEPAKNQEGQPFLLDEKVSEKAHETYSGAVQAITALDQLRALRAANGGNYTSWSVDARKKAMELERALIGMHQASGITGFRGNVMEVMEKQLTGGADPTSVLQSVAPLLDQARSNVIQDMNARLHNQYSYTGKPIDIPDPMKEGKPQETATDLDLARAKQSAYKDLPQDDVVSELGIDTTGKRSADVSKEMVSELKSKGGLLPSQRATIDNIGRLMNSPSLTEAQRAAYRQQMIGIRDDANEAGARDLADTYLRTGSTPGETIGPATETARIKPDEVIGAKKK